ncbi:MAG: hypothetical protein DME56_11900 [Verrucomicrobia bacterium]|nr:MAG: hypothetical protein DME56_11900 [Verrucomicrobiota bacterium]
MFAREDVNAQSDARDSARHRQQIFQLNELRRGRPVTDRGEQRASLAVRKRGTLPGIITCSGFLVIEFQSMKAKPLSRVSM